MDEKITETDRLAWGFADIAAVTGLSVNFLRNEHRRGKLRGRRFGRRLLVLTEDLKAYLEGNGEIEERKAAA